MTVKHVIVCLGNPEPQYENTRHNAGFHVLRTLAGDAPFVFDQGLRAKIAVITVDQHKVAIVCPMTGMNSSGEAVGAVLDRYELTPASLLVVYDDVSMPMGRLRFQHHGGAGGHHGIESTFPELGGSREFDRLKVAVGRLEGSPDPGGAERAKFVLAPIGDDILPLYNKVLETSAQAVKLWVCSGVNLAQCKYNPLTVCI